ncbi:MAG: Fic family protein [Selenomonadaceae bacterium]|nr:Fic family protein [Selenomonadaceae bacterium]MBQ9497641.1 Fic family protein [Selenomonadaceae bacterium]
MTLKNKLGLENPADLARAEEKISKQKAIQLWQSYELKNLQAGTFEKLARIHERLFEEIYFFAGKIRDENISKGHFRFASALYLREAIRSVEKMPQKTFEQIVAKYVEMNIAHPFREGNGRSMRLWLDDILKCELGQVIDWSAIDKDKYLQAMERSPIDDSEIKKILAAALTEKIDDREIFMKGLDASYFYENYFAYRSEDLTVRQVDRKIFREAK